MTVLREQLLTGRTVVLRGSVPDAVRDEIDGLGGAAAGEPASVLVYDAAGAFADGGRHGLRAAVDGAWEAILEVAVGWAAVAHPGQGRKVVLIAPMPSAGRFAAAAAAALENLARTLSVEWARHAVTATVIVPGGATTDWQIAELVCFLASSAGDYFSGCRFALGAG
jgi:NAD(P)-dependent dehydrogenase (short-subunit alcohol dehydrogenase family)